jgi:hypothetical protein
LLTMETTATHQPDAPAVVDLAAVRVELDAAVADALKQASTRAEHIRMTRIAGLVHALHGPPAA